MVSIGRVAEAGGTVIEDVRGQGFAGPAVPECYDHFLLAQLSEPWAHELVQRAGLAAEASVLDVASGLGPVARVAAAAVGRWGRVVACDISGPMLGLAAAKPMEPAWAPIEYLECSATDLNIADDTFDVVFCQHGLQFFAAHEQMEAVREMRRVAAPGRMAVISTWAAEYPVGLFGPMMETLAEAGVPEPFPRAFDPRGYALGASELLKLLRSAGFRQVSVQAVGLDAIWQTTDDAVAALLGTPFGPLVSALPADGQEWIRQDLARRLGAGPDGQVIIRTVSNVAQGVK